jgi:hypothetical protein
VWRTRLQRNWRLLGLPVISREVLPPRRALTVRSVVLSLLLVGCSAHMAASRLAPPIEPPLVIATGIPLTVWNWPSLQENGYGCQPRQVRPATYCQGGEMAYDGCFWTCRASYVEPRQ